MLNATTVYTAMYYHHHRPTIKLYSHLSESDRCEIFSYFRIRVDGQCIIHRVTQSPTGHTCGTLPFCCSGGHNHNAIGCIATLHIPISPPHPSAVRVAATTPPLFVSQFVWHSGIADSSSTSTNKKTHHTPSQPTSPHHAPRRGRVGDCTGTGGRIVIIPAW